MPCDKYKELMSASLDGALTPQEDRWLAAHLADCVPCREDQAALEQTVRLLAHLPRAAVPATLRDRIEAAASAPPTRRPSRWAMLAAKAAVALVLLGGGITLVGYFAPEPPAAATVRHQEILRGYAHYLSTHPMVDGAASEYMVSEAVFKSAQEQEEEGLR